MRLRVPVSVQIALPILVAALPLLVAGVRAAAGPWIPIGDDAYFTVRSLDVATEHHPLVGAWSAGSLDVGRPINNLGPVQLDLLAPFTRWTPWGGTAIGVIAVHIAAITAIGWMIARLLGPIYVLAAMVAVSMMTWTMGSEMLITPQQHQYLLLPYLCVLVAAWCIAAGDRWALVPAVFFASLLAQTHLSYPILLVGVALVAAVGHLASRRTRTGGGTAEAPTPYIVAASLAVVLWLQTAIDQFAGTGNLVDVLGSGGNGESPDLATAVRIVAGVIVSPSGYARPGYGGYGEQATLGNGAQVAVLYALVGAIAVGLVFALRRRRRVAAAGLGVALAALVAGIVDAASLPITDAFGLLANNYRWLWPTATLLVLGGLCATVRAIERGSPQQSSAQLRAVTNGTLWVILVVAVTANLPTSYQVDRPDEYRNYAATTRAIVDQLEEVPLSGPVVIDESNMFLGHTLTYPIITELRRRGIDYRFESPMQARRFGEARVSDGSDPQRLVLWFGSDAVDRREGPGTVAFADGEPPVAVTLVEPAMEGARRTENAASREPAGA